MIENFERVVDAGLQAIGLLLDDAASVNPLWIVPALVLHVVSQAVRTRGWHTIIRAAYPRAIHLRVRDVVAAYFAGAGVNAVVPARGGDILKLFFVHRKVKGSRYSTLAATFVPETLFETLVGIGLVIWALTQGFIPVPASPSELPTLDISLIVRNPVVSAVVAGTLASGLFFLVRVLRRRARDFLRRLRQGLAILDRPGDYLRGVVTWQALGRVIRLGSLACFMAAFDLPVTLSTVILVMAAQGGGRIIPIAPVSAGLRIAMLSYGFVEVTGDPVDIASITAFSFGTGALVLLLGLTISAVLIFRELGTLSPRAAVRAARTALQERRASQAASA